MTTEQNKLILKFIPQQKKHNKTLDEEITHNNNLWAISLQYQTNKENINGKKYIDGLGLTSSKEVNPDSIIELCNEVLDIYNKNDLSNADQKTRSFFAKRSKEIWHFYY